MICDKCQTRIKKKSDDYYEVRTYEQGNLTKKGFMHKNCNDTIRAQREREKKLIAASLALAGKVNKMIDDIGDDGGMVVEIK